MITNLSIPDNATVEEWENGEPGMLSGAGSGYSRIRLRLDSASFAKVVEQAKKAGFRQLPATETARFPSLKLYSAADVRGRYEIWVDSARRAYRITVLDARYRDLFVQRAY